MNRQEIYDTVKKHLLTQGKKSEIVGNYGAECVYRGPDGLRCAIGALIPDYLFDSSMENKTVRSLLKDHPEVAEHLGATYSEDRAFLECLQGIHDCNTPAAWSEQLERLARSLGLNP